MTWPTVQLGEIATIERIGVDPSTLDLETPYVGLENIDSNGNIDISSK